MGKVIINNKSYSEMKGNFFIVPNDLGLVLSEMNLKPNDRLIYLTMLRFANNSGNPFPSYKKIREYTGISSDSTVSSSLKRLEESGLIEKIHRGTTQGDSNVYKVNYAYLEKSETAYRKAQEPQKEIKQVNTPKAPRQQPYKVNEENVVIPFKRGIHDEIVTSKEAQEMLNYFESDEYQQSIAFEEARTLELLGL